MTTTASQAAGGGVARYGAIARLLHWLIVALVIAQFAIAWTMPDIPRGRPPEGLVNLHLSVGATILIVMLIRLAWRLLHGAPASIVAPPWQRTAACTVHTLLYVLLIGSPLAGWAWASSKSWPVTLFGLATLPPLVPADWPYRWVASTIHANVAWAILGLVGLHALAALWHHVVQRDDVLRRMLP